MFIPMPEWPDYPIIFNKGKTLSTTKLITLKKYILMYLNIT